MAEVRCAMYLGMVALFCRAICFCETVSWWVMQEVGVEVRTLLEVAVGIFVKCFFFFQAEDGIRDRNVTGVQTCALPISACRCECKGEEDADPECESVSDHVGSVRGLGDRRVRVGPRSYYKSADVRSGGRVKYGCGCVNTLNLLENSSPTRVRETQAGAGLRRRTEPGSHASRRHAMLD